MTEQFLMMLGSALLTGAATYGALRVELRWLWAETTRAHTEIRELKRVLEQQQAIRCRALGNLPEVA